VRVTGFWSAVGAVILAVVAADFLIHPTGTAQLANAGTTAEKTALNAELGQTS
jgi:hypothetical protein